MANFHSKYVSAFGWDIQTDSDPGAGTDSLVTLTILREDFPVISLVVEPGETGRLDRGASQFFMWQPQGTFFVPATNVTWIASLPYPNAVEFPDGVEGHMRAQFQIHGDDMWKKDKVSAYVKYSHYEAVPGTIDSFVWVEDLNWSHVGDFTQDVEMSTDSTEGLTTWTLLY